MWYMFEMVSNGWTVVLLNCNGAVRDGHMKASVKKHFIAFIIEMLMTPPPLLRPPPSTKKKKDGAFIRLKFGQCSIQ